MYHEEVTICYVDEHVKNKEFSSLIESSSHLSYLSTPAHYPNRRHLTEQEQYGRVLPVRRGISPSAPECAIVRCSSPYPALMTTSFFSFFHSGYEEKKDRLKTDGI